MSPARVEEDPVTAEYDIFLTESAQADHVYLLQYPTRAREKPYNRDAGLAPIEMRIKPNSGHLEMDVNLNTDHNFNKHKGLKWGDAIKTGREVQNGVATYGMPAGFAGGVRGRNTGRVVVKNKEDRDMGLANDMIDFNEAEDDNKVMKVQTLGGHIIKHDSSEETGKPAYFVGAFKGTELHLTKVDGTVQMRPQFHHLDAEDQRNRIVTTRAATAANPNPAADNPRAVHQSYKNSSANPKGELEQREHEMKMSLQTAREEPWTKLEYVDEDDDLAYEVWNERMFLRDTEGAEKLVSSMSDEQYLDAISAPGKEGLGKRRRRARRGRGGEIVEVGDGDADETVGEGG